jgi:hypothetical protein
MKTKWIVFFAFAMSIGTIKAQLFTGGIVAGASTSSIKISDVNSTVSNSLNGENILGFEAGLFAKLNLWPFYIKPMALISYQDGQLGYNDKDGNLQHTNFADGKLEIPLLFGFKILGPVYLEGGPVYNWLFQANTDANNVVVAPNGLGYRIGAGVELGRINIGLSYQGLTNKSSGSTNSTFSMPYELILGLGIRLGRTKE